MSKLQVHADTDDALVKFDRVIRIRCGNGWGPGDGCRVIAATITVIAGRIPQINKQIFKLERPILGKSNFNSRTDRPAEFRITLVW
jgi:hypothetical protein